MSTLRERLESASKRRVIERDFPLVGKVKIRSLVAREMADIRGRFTTAAGEPNKQAVGRLRQFLVAACVVDDDGNTAYTLDDVDAGKLDDIDGGVLEAMASTITEHVGWGANADWRAVADAAKN